jgi:hypothetical protein
MALNLPQLAQVGRRAATQVGVTGRATIKRPAPPPNPLTGAASGSEQTQTPHVSSVSPQKFANSDAMWSTVAMAFYLTALDATFAPLRGDLVTFGGVSGRITAMKVDTETGTTIGWFLGVEA